MDDSSEIFGVPESHIRIKEDKLSPRLKVGDFMTNAVSGQWESERMLNLGFQSRKGLFESENVHLVATRTLGK
jgi:hypothetical protein